MSFQIHAVDPAAFAPLFAMSEDELSGQFARRVIADAKPGYPCRVSLQDAEPGETLILAHFMHQPANSPFRSSHAVYVREGAVPAELDPGDIPAQFSHRLMSVRAFDTAGMMRDADVVEGTSLRPVIDRMLAAPETAELHLHYARPGCFAARVTRA
ncbi:MAG: hypothetical protein CMF74_01985 [Maricaulis sp.]|jgi:hypothetical protein|nr:hypothetical protein [Maricaulis sp.]HAQ35383.1 DUF1203 domain-containing protein [Alphaproteobacteria bacterium]|tara:strand:+ start:219 stop:686 length:468 start_codon:yes stop_codon:yes gene_type:complete